jgi:hypothetical protein
MQITSKEKLILHESGPLGLEAVFRQSQGKKEIHLV